MSLSLPKDLYSVTASHRPEQCICIPVKVACALCQHKPCKIVVQILGLLEVELHV